MTEIQKMKRPIRAFMRAHYTDERLAQLLCHARDSKLSYMSCCCFIGVVTASHALQGYGPFSCTEGSFHIITAGRLEGADVAEESFQRLHINDGDRGRRRILIPMIRAEMKRREQLRAADVPSVHVALARSEAPAEVGAK